jgi:hypothetical protein
MNIHQIKVLYGNTYCQYSSLLHPNTVGMHPCRFGRGLQHELILIECLSDDSPVKHVHTFA